MAKYSRGDRVLINGSLLATIQTYDEVNDRIAYVVVPPGGGTDTTYGHISQTRVERLVLESAPEDPAKEVAPVKAASKDEITGSSSR